MKTYNRLNFSVPLPPFRTNNWNFPEAPYSLSEDASHREEMRSLQKNAKEWLQERMIREA